MGSYSVDESVLDLPTILYSYSSAVASGYASTDESANSDALSNPVLPDESHSVYALSSSQNVLSWFTPSIKGRCMNPFLLRKNKSWNSRFIRLNEKKRSYSQHGAVPPSCLKRLLVSFWLRAALFLCTRVTPVVPVHPRLEIERPKKQGRSHCWIEQKPWIKAEYRKKDLQLFTLAIESSGPHRRNPDWPSFP